jgi:hypothetical protein
LLLLLLLTWPCTCLYALIADTLFLTLLLLLLGWLQFTVLCCPLRLQQQLEYGTSVWGGGQGGPAALQVACTPTQHSTAQHDSSAPATLTGLPTTGSVVLGPVMVKLLP